MMRMFELTAMQLKVLELEEWIAEVNAECLNQPVLTEDEKAYAKRADRAQAYVDSIIGKFDISDWDISDWQPLDADFFTRMRREWWASVTTKPITAESLAKLVQP